MKYIEIEEDFEHCGYRCLVVVNRMCIRCGYVGVPNSHPDYKKSYTEVEEKYSVHGGLTFSDEIEYIGALPDDLWYFGFDCGHYGDMYAVDDAVKYGLRITPSMAEMFRLINETVVNECSKEYVKEQCMLLAKQLKEMEKNYEKKL